MKKALVILSVLVLVVMTGCHYDVPEFQEIGPSESAFMIPLIGDGSQQVKFDSEESLKKMLVSAKRVQIPHIKQDTGRLPWDFKYVNAVLLLKVDRQPITREWTHKKDGIWVESKDSVGFSSGIVISAMIEEPDAALFLFRYRNGSLAEVMDKEIRAKIVSVFSDISAKYDMSDLRTRKNEIITEIRDQVIPFFKTRGITITTIGMSEGFAYENPKIQEGIDAVFIAQREKEITAAQLAAQQDKNAKIEKEAEALAAQELKLARAKADAQSMMIKVSEDAARNPVFIKMRELEVKMKMIEKWNGAFPKFMVGGGSSGHDVGGMMFNISAEQAAAADKE